MYGYKLQKPKEIPTIVWACKTNVKQYRWENRNQTNMLEFSVCKASKRTVAREEGTPEVVVGESFECIVGDARCQSYAADDVNVDILSVAVSFADLSYVRKPLDIEDFSDEDVLLLPASHGDIPFQKITHFENLLYRIVDFYKEHSAAADMMCAATVLTVMYELDRLMRQSLQRKRDKYVHYYVDKAEAILLSRYAQAITVRGVAEILGITPNYLSAIFKESKGCTFLSRLQEIRMKRAAEMLLENRWTVDEIAMAVGYEEIGSFRRRFKQYFGVSIRDFCCINQELTLYHPKPQKQSEESIPESFPKIIPPCDMHP